MRYSFLAQLVKIMGTAPFTGIAVKELFGSSTRSSNDPATRSMLNAWTAKLRSRPKNIARSLLGVMTRPEFSAQELAAIRCPTLIIAGEEDTPQPPSNSERLAAAIPNSTLVRIPASGHSSSLEQPDAVIAAMRALIEGKTRSADQR